MRAKILGLGCACLAAAGLWATPAQAVPNGLVIRAGLDGGYLWWRGKHRHELSVPGHAARLEREPHAVAPAIGGRLATGWKIVLHPNVSLLPRMGLAYAQSGRESSHLSTALHEYDFELEASWESIDIGAEAQLFGEWLSASVAGGVGQITSTETVRTFASSRHQMTLPGYLLRADVGVRAPPQHFVVGGLNLAFEVINLDPIPRLVGKIHLSRASRLMLMATIEFDGVYFRPEAGP